jgi:hypothetical protein
MSAVWSDGDLLRLDRVMDIRDHASPQEHNRFKGVAARENELVTDDRTP